MKSILVIEDNPFNMKLTDFLLKNAGYKVIQATDAETGIEQLQAHMPDLILMDMQLPGMDGMSATRLLKSTPALAKIPVIALTAHAMKDDEEIMRGICDGYLAKPFHHQALLDMVGNMLAKDA
jgi:two-component system cell cycle response regulator DivK